MKANIALLKKGQVTRLLLAVLLLILAAACSAPDATNEVADTVNAAPTAETAAPEATEVPPTPEPEPTDPPPTEVPPCDRDALAEADQIVVGAIMPLSEPGSISGGLVMQAAFNIAAEEINNAGGILGKSLRLVEADTAGTPEIGKEAAERLVMEKCVVGIVGEYHSAVGLEIMEVAHEYRVPTIFAETYNDDITAAGYPEVFRIAPTSSLTAQMDARWLAEVGDYNGDGTVLAAVIAEDTAFGQGQVERTETWFPEFDLETAVFLVEVPTTDFAPVIAEIQELEQTPDAIFIKVTGETSFALQNQLIEAELGPNEETIIVANQVALNDETFWQQVPEGTYTVVPRIGPWPSTVSERGDAFATNYQTLYDRWPEAYAFEAYDALWLMADAIERAGTVEPDAVIEALEASDIELASGRYTFPFGAANPPDGDTPAYMWHQWPDVPLLFVQYSEPNQTASDMAVIWPDTYRTESSPVIRASATP